MGWGLVGLSWPMDAVQCAGKGSRNMKSHPVGSSFLGTDLATCQLERRTMAGGGGDFVNASFSARSDPLLPVFSRGSTEKPVLALQPVTSAVGSLERAVSGSGDSGSRARGHRRGWSRDAAASQPSLRAVIIELIAIRQRNDIHCRSPVSLAAPPKRQSH